MRLVLIKFVPHLYRKIKKLYISLIFYSKVVHYLDYGGL